MADFPYKGTAPVMNDLLGGHVPVAFGVIPPALGNIQAGKLRAVAVASLKRSSLLPDTPTFDESGLPGFEGVLHYGVLAPAGTPKEVIARLNAAMSEVINVADMKAALNLQGLEPQTTTPEQFGAFIQSDIMENAKLIKLIGLKAE